LRQAAAGVDARFFAHAFRSGELHVRDGLASARFAMALLAAFAVIAAVMAAVGLYGVVSYGVHQRTREIGLRVALGASPSDVARLVVGGGMRLGLIGVILGTAIAVGSAPVLRGLLYGIAPTDPLTFVAIAAVVGATAGLASYLPTRRALRIDPTEALRAE
jgi:ABC-type antimicrobial peptide transport system permease subunit